MSWTVLMVKTMETIVKVTEMKTIEVTVIETVEVKVTDG